MAEVKVGKNESLDRALRRFKKQCARTGVLSEARRRADVYKRQAAGSSLFFFLISIIQRFTELLQQLRVQNIPGGLVNNFLDIPD